MDSFYILKVLVGAATVISGAEVAYNQALYSKAKLDFRILATNEYIFHSPALSSKQFLLINQNMWSLVNATRIAAAITMIVSGNDYIICAASFLIFLTTLYFCTVCIYGTEGSDQLIIFLSFLLFYYFLFRDNQYVDELAAIFISTQMAISYFISGFSKILSPVWRDGTGIRGVMNTECYGSPIVARHLPSSLYFWRAASWSVMLIELMFPLCMICGGYVLMISLLLLFIFHLATAIFMGLYGFFLIFTSPYAVIYSYWA